MPITITCPFCDHSRQLPDGFPNKRAKCPKCGTFVEVPQPEEEPRRGTPQWVIAVLVSLGALALFLLGTVALTALRGGEEDGGPDSPSDPEAALSRALVAANLREAPPGPGAPVHSGPGSSAR
jgi:hypothetical protein